MKKILEQIMGVVTIMRIYPVMILFFIILAFLVIVANIRATNEFLSIALFFGGILILVLLIAILTAERNAKQYLQKIFFVSIFWFGSCLALVDFVEFNFSMFLQLLTSYEYVFLGCLIPDYIVTYNVYKIKKDKEFEEMKNRMNAMEENWRIIAKNIDCHNS